MSVRYSVICLAATLALTTACTNKKVNNPLAKVDSKQPDKVLFDRGMDAMKHNHFDIARLDMQTLINTYPDSEFIARAKLSLADSWYAEGGTAALAQAEQEYEDFITFFPNMPEAAEAQFKIANIQYQQMEKPDRDFTHAVRAEQEYRKVILQYPDNQQMVAEARKKLLQVQEVIAEREYGVGRFYYLKESYPAAIARLQSLVDRYPLYSKADETLYLLGQAYEGEIALLKKMDGTEREQMEKLHKFNEAQLKRDELARERMSNDFAEKAAAAYSKIITRYPAMNRADDARARLAALHQPIPRPTKAALALNKAEEAGRGEQTLLSKMMSAFERHPDVSPATKIGDPTLTDPTPMDARAIVQAAGKVALGPGSKGNDSLTVQPVNPNPGANEAAPRSDSTSSGSSVANADGSATAAQEQADPNELKPNAAASDPAAQAATAPDPNELKPNVSSDQPAPPPAQVNQIQPGNDSPAANPQNASDASGQQLATDQDLASSKHKKKKGLLHKVIPGN
ncbi:MAG TPA: outer membrane protein assembly factor BamD [Terriglobales bacterium]|nr:outer membrane protein assembly factor BamD [Terriglobales bacterium]